MIAFPTFERLTVKNYRLFPGATRGEGLDFTFQEGISLIVGVNGLGKTTLINMLFRLLVGPNDLPKDNSNRTFGANARASVSPWDQRRRFFTQRVSDRAKDAYATLTYKLGTVQVEVTRSLDSCHLQRAVVGEQLLEREDAYQQAVTEAAGVGNFADFLTMAKYLTFFNEERRNILWDEQAQRQFFRILFLTAKDSRNWAELEAEIGKHDSNARNMSAIAFRFEQELKELTDEFRRNEGLGDELSVKEQILLADIATKAGLDEQLLTLDVELKEVRRSLERAKLYEDDAERNLEAIRYGALHRLFPDLNETATYVLTHLFSDGRCLACEADAPQERRRFDQALESGDCAVCGARQAEQRRLQVSEKIAPATEVERRRLEKAREDLAAASAKRQADAAEEERLMQRRRRVLDELANLTVRIADQQAENERLRAMLPPTPEELQNRQKAIDGIRKEEERAKARRAEKEAIYGELITRLQETIQAATGRIAETFSALASAFLEEECSISFRMVTGRPSVQGEPFQYPALKFEMTAAAFEGLQIRERPEDVSESQREFIDLAFRMALMITASQDGPGALVMETPEASLDAIFMERAAALLTGFGTRGRRVILTSNLTNTALIPGLLGTGPAKDDGERRRRWARVLNLLEEAEPNAAVRRFGTEYRDLLKSAVEGGPNAA